MKNFKFIILSIFILLPLISFSQQDCDKLQKYRDNELFNDYVKTQEKYQVNAQKLARFKGLKKDLENVSFGSTSKTIGEIAMMVEATANLTKDLLSMLPAAKLITESEDAVFFTADVIHKKFIEGKDVKDVVKEMAVAEIKSNAFKHLNPAFKAADAIYSFTKKIKEMKEFSKDADNLLNSVKEQMNTYENAINKYQRKISEQEYKLNHINNVKEAIDKYCGGSPILKIMADMDCKITIDFDKSKLAGKNSIVEFSLKKGEHFISAASVEGNAKWDTTVNITVQKPKTIYTRLKKKIVKTAPVIFIANTSCSLIINGKEKVELEQNSGGKINLPFGKHIIKAKTTGKIWEKTINITDEKQKIIRIEFKADEIKPRNGTFTDSRDGKTYKYVTIGNQTWMAENLAYNAGSGCWAYNDSRSNVSRYGYLYNWQTAKNVCPSGWHLPSKSEFETLLNNYGGSKGYNENYRALKQGGSSGFSASFGGWRGYNGNYNLIGEYGDFWSSSARGDAHAWLLGINSEFKKAYIGYSYNLSWGLSVRCLQDN
jgi:uncharacterized protein (TIGR02145 family)